MFDSEKLKELYKESYKDSALEKGEVDSINLSIVEVLLREISIEEFDELTFEAMEEYGIVTKTPEQLKIEELEAKLNALLAKG